MTDEPASATSRVLVIGEALMDIAQREGQDAEEYVGGSPANVALGLGRLGVPVRLRTALGRDPRGSRIAAHLAASGVEVETESFVLERTSTATARISDGGDADYAFDIEWRLGAAVELRDAKVVHVGSIGCFIEPGGPSVLAALRSFDARAAVTFDPNIRPALVGDRARAQEVTERIAALSDVVKLSDEDAGWLYPASTVDEVVDRVLELGVRVVAVTLGRAGAVLASRDTRVTVDGRSVPVEDTVGAGDTFMAAIVATLAAGGLGADAITLRAAGERAVAAASITVGRRGADLPSHADLERLLAVPPA